MQTSNIDDVLMSSSAKSVEHPATPEYVSAAREELPEPEAETLREQKVRTLKEPEPDILQESDKAAVAENEDIAEPEAKEEKKADANLDEYGNEKPKGRTYTEEEHNEILNKKIRERIARMERNGAAPTQQQQAAAPKDFVYDENSPDAWQHQLEQFIDNTLVKREQRVIQQHQQQQQQAVEEAFQSKFMQGADEYEDFSKVVATQPITDAMTMALRAVNNPAGFIYTASKYAAEELKTISQMSDPISQVVAMGKLEERLRKGKVTTNAPPPIRRTKEDGNIVHPSDRQPSFDDVLIHSDKVRQAKFNQTRRRG